WIERQVADLKVRGSSPFGRTQRAASPYAVMRLSVCARVCFCALYAFGVGLDHAQHIEYAADHLPIGVEFLRFRVGFYHHVAAGAAGTPAAVVGKGG
ncbi:MAG TPA: hypothetical protein VKX96_01065, partial [Chloroflexota bacterium]|nr:hypothetical protein [Chloroflexota bacterium]